MSHKLYICVAETDTNHWQVETYLRLRDANRFLATVEQGGSRFAGPFELPPEISQALITTPHAEDQLIELVAMLMRGVE